MKRLAAGLAAGAVAALTATAASAGTSGSVQLTPLASVRFPYRAFVLTTPKPVLLGSGQIVVRENGQPVNGVSIVRATQAASGTFGVVLVIDASDSMRGASIASALQAARVFAAYKAGGAALGLVTFNSTVRTAVQLTTNKKAIAASLSRTPRLAAGTHLWDATSFAIDALKTKKIRAGSIVLLTDGRDTGSKVTVNEVVSKARAAHVRIFAVGLRSPQYTPGPLRTLSQDTGGAYDETSAAGLSGIYRSRSQQFAQDYLLRYRSLAGPGVTIHVHFAATGVPGVGTWTYRTPALPSIPKPPYHRSLIRRFVLSRGSVVVMSLLAAWLIWFAISRLLRQRESTLRERVGEFASGQRARAIKRQVTPPHEWFMESVVPSAERFLARYSWWERFKEELEIANFPIRAVPLAAITASATILLAILLGVISPALALLSLGVPVLVRSLYKTKLRKIRDAFEEQLPGNLQVLAASLRAGHSFIGALSAVIDEADEPSRSELRRAVADDRLGIPVEDALMGVAKRMASGDLEQVALVAALQRETGGNTAEVLDTVVDACRERFELRGLVKALTAQGRLSRWILTGLPIGVALVILVLNPSYLKPLVTTSSGQVMLAVAIGLLVTGSYVIKRITDIEI